ncbi:ribosomal protein YMR-31 [Microdochium bolleyi]|uniref:Ribosomal protein YMR-31 n=1 Tax=Microdochium bolleyi TaxID=196109 RepID=A0A136JHN1_9PEZI|nr:ribosomal protein YMR-31 [Microdochium bolleyi]
MLATRALRQAAHATTRTPMIQFIGKRSIPSDIDHTPKPHPEAPGKALPGSFGSSPNGNSHVSFSSYRDGAQQHGPLRKTLGLASGAALGPVNPPQGQYFDRNELPLRFRRAPLDLAEIEAIETGGATLFG